MITDNKLEEVNILLCEDDESLGMLLREYLEAKGYHTTLCQDGEEGFDTFLQGSFSLCILDVMMPRMDGFTLAKKIRELNYDMPFMFLTAKNLKDDVREGFELGADDYITKPFSMEEVVFRIEAILRRVHGKKNKDQAVRQIGKFTFDTQKQMLYMGNKQEKLTTKEAELLTLLSNRQNELLQRDYALAFNGRLHHKTAQTPKRRPECGNHQRAWQGLQACYQQWSRIGIIKEGINKKRWTIVHLFCFFTKESQ